MNPVMIVINQHKLAVLSRQKLCCIRELEMNNNEKDAEMLRWNADWLISKALGKEQMQESQKLSVRASV